MGLIERLQCQPWQVLFDLKAQPLTSDRRYPQSDSQNDFRICLKKGEGGFIVC